MITWILWERPKEGYLSKKDNIISKIKVVQDQGRIKVGIEIDLMKKRVTFKENIMVEIE